MSTIMPSDVVRVRDGTPAPAESRWAGCLGTVESHYGDGVGVWFRHPGIPPREFALLPADALVVIGTDPEAVLLDERRRCQEIIVRAVATLNVATGYVGSVPVNAAAKNAISAIYDSILTVEVVIKNMTFTPAVATVLKGAAVLWVNRDSVEHTVTVIDGRSSYTSEPLAPGATFRHAFFEVGEYPYRCGRHPRMTGVVTVV